MIYVNPNIMGPSSMIWLLIEWSCNRKKPTLLASKLKVKKKARKGRQEFDILKMTSSMQKVSFWRQN